LDGSQVSNHLELVKADPQRLAAAAHCAEELSLSMARAEEQARLVLGEDAEALGGLCTDRSFLATSDAQHCGKMVALKQLLGQWAAERGRGGADAPKVLLFSYSTRMLDILESLMNRYGYSYSRLDGSTNQRERQERVDHFNNSNSCFVYDRPPSSSPLTASNPLTFA
jgi:SNF2 family DNA or RNA helicase